MLNELKAIGAIGGDAVAGKAGEHYLVRFNLATSETWKDAQGNKQERTTWIDCTRWVKTQQAADNTAKYLTKGSKVYVSGLASARAYINENTKEAVAVLGLRIDQMKIIHSTRPKENQSTPPPPTVDNYNDDDDLPF